MKEKHEILFGTIALPHIHEKVLEHHFTLFPLGKSPKVDDGVILCPLLSVSEHSYNLLPFLSPQQTPH